jgi:formylglycine-generating enzyme required for sulfatase activity
MMKGIGNFVVALAVCACAAGARAQVTIETVTVGNPGNTGELSGAGAGGYGPDRVCGAVDYVYRIGKFEVTAGQYTEFLNAVADEDTYGLYNTNMWSHGYACKIERTGSSPNYSYSVAPDWADRPVNFVSWGDAARFANWLHNGQPTGVQDLTTTEDGSYYLNGAISDAALLAVVREPDATWVIPSEDEWYKAAYHKNDGVTGNYWDYPTGSNTAPRPEAPPGRDMTNGSANYYGIGFAIGPPYYRTEVGAYDAKPSDSPYGTFDQGGNVREWNEAILYGSYRGERGGSFFGSDFGSLLAAGRSNYYPSLEGYYFGFRVAQAQVPGDLDHDGDVDLYDFAVMQAGFTGPQ